MIPSRLQITNKAEKLSIYSQAITDSRPQYKFLVCLKIIVCIDLHVLINTSMHALIFDSEV